MKRLIALILTLTTVIAAFASCAAPKTAEELIAEADAAMAANPYKATMSMSMDCDNDLLASTFENMNYEFTAYVDGNNYITEMGEGATVTVVDGVSYTKYSFGNEEYKIKDTLSESEIADGMAQFDVNETFDTEIFENKELANVDGKSVITFTAIKADEVDEFLGDAFGALEDADLTLDDLKLVITLKDGKYESVVMTFGISMEVMTVSASIDCEVKMTIDHGAGKTVTAPEDADSYVES